MVCYAIPRAVAIFGLIAHKKFGFNGKHSDWFVLLFSGGALFGVIDHLWNGELFLFGENLLMDLLLGIAISIGITVTWAVIVLIDTKAVQPLELRG